MRKYGGRFVVQRLTQDVFDNLQTDYTKELMAAAFAR